MFFEIDIEKAIEASYLLLRLTKHHCMDRKRLLALLFLIDRESIKRIGRPVVGGRICALRHGPIQSEVYDMIKGSHCESSTWDNFFGSDSYRVTKTKDCPISKLSKYEIDLIEEVSNENSGLGTWDVANKTHTFEYEKNYKSDTSNTIPLEDLIDGVNRSADKQMIVKDAEEKRFFEKLFSGEK